MKFVVAGGTGWIGRALVNKIKTQFSDATVLTISRFAGKDTITWRELKERGLPEDTNVVVNTTGKNVFDARWSDSFKQELMSSRIEPAKTLVEAISKLESDQISKGNESPIRLFITTCGSAVPPSQIVTYDEQNTQYGSEFVGQLCQKVEEASKLKEDSRVRQLVCRVPMVLGPTDGGALQKMAPVFNLGLGGILGSGQQELAWVHLDDLTSIMTESVVNEKYNGVVHCVAPQIITNAELTKSLATAMNRPALFWVPEMMCRLMYGEAATLLLDNRRIISSRLSSELGFTFKYPDVSSALSQIFNSSSSSSSSSSQ